jgi:hypothetical protein
MVGKELLDLLQGQYALTLRKDNVFIAQSE